MVGKSVDVGGFMASLGSITRTINAPKLVKYSIRQVGAVSVQLQLHFAGAVMLSASGFGLENERGRVPTRSNLMQYIHCVPC